MYLQHVQMSYQSQDAIFALKVDSNVRLDEVAGQHGDANSQVS